VIFLLQVKLFKEINKLLINTISMSYFKPDEKLEKLLNRLNEINGLKPIMCGVCGDWNVVNVDEWNKCNKCNIFVCQIDYVKDVNGIGLCADCHAN